jgi:hypothetical protein
MAHTEARVNATKKGAKYLSLPDYSIKQLSSPSLTVDFLKCAQNAAKIKKILDKGKNINISSYKLSAKCDLSSKKLILNG